MLAEETKEEEPSVPRRAAARRATRLSAEQLESSPNRSGGEVVDPTTFGEPSRSKVVVKKTYGGKVRGKLSPLKQIPESSQSSTSRVVRKSKSLSHLNSPTPSRRRKPPPANSTTTAPAKQSRGKGKKKAPSPTPTISDDSEIDFPVLPTPSSRPKLIPPATATPTANGKNTIQKDTILSKKRPRSPPPSVPQSPATDLSTLTPLQSPEQTQISLPFSGPPASRDLTRALTSPTFHSISDVEETWNLNNLGSHVWLSINSSGEPSESNSDTLWWPAKVVHSPPLSVSLFGNPPSSLGTDIQQTLPIHNPSSKLVLSLKTSRGSVRFHEKNYTPRPLADDLRSSPRKRQKTAEMDVHNRWLDALSLFLRADAAENDGLPSTLSRFGSGVLFSDPPEHSGDEMDDVKEIDEDEDEFQPKEYSGPMEIPGELVLAREKKASSDYWPAKVMAYIPPEKRSLKPKFEVHYFDGIVKKVPRDMFYTDSDPGFAKCKLGRTAGNYGLDEEERDLNGDFTMSDDTGDTDEPLRPSSPTPTLPVSDKFALQYTIPEQFDYVKPVLVAVLQGRYDTARSRHEAFMRSEASRKDVCDTSHNKGDLRAREVEELDAVLRRWVRRRQKRQELGLIPRDESDTYPAPQAPPTRAEKNVSVEDHMLPVPQAQTSISEDLNVTQQHEGVTPPSSSKSAVKDQDEQLPASSPKEPLSNTDVEHGSAPSTNISGVDAPMPPPLSPKSKDPSVVDNPSTTPCQEPTHAAKPSPSRKSFASLSPIDQITYCTNILLPEAILQLLLWRSGLRKSLELLSPSEEEELHSRAEEKAREVNWVHQVVYAKRAVTGSMLPSLRRSGQTPKPDEAVAGTLRSGRNR